MSTHNDQVVPVTNPNPQGPTTAPAVQKTAEEQRRANEKADLEASEVSKRHQRIEK